MRENARGGSAAVLGVDRGPIFLGFGWSARDERIAGATPFLLALPEAPNDASLRRMSRDSNEEGPLSEPDEPLNLDSLYRRHWDELCRYVFRNFGGGPPDPEDVAQQAFLRLSGVGEAVQNVGSFLRKTARNLVIDHYRASLRTKRVLESVSVLDDTRSEFSPEDVLSSKEALLMLESIISELPPKERVALLMHRVDGASFTDIADHLGVSHSGARLLVSRAFERCAAILEERS